MIHADLGNDEYRMARADEAGFDLDWFWTHGRNWACGRKVERSRSEIRESQRSVAARQSTEVCGRKSGGENVRRFLISDIRTLISDNYPRALDLHAHSQMLTQFSMDRFGIL